MKLSGYKEAGVQYEGFLIDNGIQEQVLQEFGFQGLLETEDYRAQCLRLKEIDEEIANACVWLKYDVMKQGHLKVYQADVYPTCSNTENPPLDRRLVYRLPTRARRWGGNETERSHDPPATHPGRWFNDLTSVSAECFSAAQGNGSLFALC